MGRQGNFGCSDHEIAEFKIAGGGSRAKGKITSLDFRRDFDLFRDLLERVLWDKAPEGRGAKKAC